MLALSRPSRRWRPTAWLSRSTAQRTRALRGAVWDKAVPYCQQAGARPGTAPRLQRGGGLLEQPSRPSHTCSSPATPGGRPPRSAWLLEYALTPWESIGGALPCWARPRP